MGAGARWGKGGPGGSRGQMGVEGQRLISDREYPYINESPKWNSSLLDI